ncbi:hypothetical protein N8I71_05390 [Roseibacterium sp. SDUM158016]|uniref:hypothetical protein n=1 Tax=Roseicyclus sediminis TaxID=2980997 RepID=UPI0021D0B7CB|nr:hypothetical protein [Roseibacterium sp. SDUM158016]MCU4652252.1 hypothetical protein [Roseibacterium sp. SDUM158016]
MTETKFNLRRASVPQLRARYSLPETTNEEKRRIREELVKRQKAALKAKRSGKTPKAEISRIYTAKSLGRKVGGGRCG